MKPDNTNNRLPEFILQIMGALAFFGMFYADRVAHVIDPPLNDLWYAVAVGIAVFGSGFAKMLDRFRKK